MVQRLRLCPVPVKCQRLLLSAHAAFHSQHAASPEHRLGKTGRSWEGAARHDNSALTPRCWQNLWNGPLGTLCSVISLSQVRLCSHLLQLLKTFPRGRRCYCPTLQRHKLRWVGEVAGPRPHTAGGLNSQESREAPHHALKHSE